jgi:hypothetical protein
LQSENSKVYNLWWVPGNDWSTHNYKNNYPKKLSLDDAMDEWHELNDKFPGEYQVREISL